MQLKTKEGMGMSVIFDCFECKHLKTETSIVEDDFNDYEGHEYFCQHPDVDQENNIIGHGSMYIGFEKPCPPFCPIKKKITVNFEIK